MKQMTKRFFCVLLSVLMLLSMGAVQLASAAAAVGRVETLKATTVSQSQIRLKWSKVKKADGYCVYSYDAKKDAWLAETYTTETTFTDKGLAPGTKYTYKVAAFVKNGTSRTFGKDSPKASALTKPERVQKLTAKISKSVKVKLTWGAAAGADGYVIYASFGDGSYKKAGSTKARTWTVTYPGAPGTVCYKVRAFAKSGKTTQYAAKFSPVAKVSAKPAKVESVTATNIGGASATLKWPKAAGASEYVIWRKDVGTGDDFVKTAVVKTNTYEVKYPASPRTVQFSVQASATVKGRTTQAAVSAPVKIALMPKPVTSLTLKKAGHNSLTLQWNKADGAPEYHVYQYISGELTEIGVTDQLTYVVRDLEPATSYTFHVRAFANYEGLETKTAFSPVLTARTSFGTVKNATVVLNSNNTAVLSWNALDGATGYEVEKKTGDDWTKLGESKTTMFNISEKESGGKLAQGKTYLYRVRAFVTEGDETAYSPYTDVIEVHSVPGKPEKAKAAAASDHAIVIDWPAVPGADGYHIQYYNKNGKWVDDVDLMDYHSYKAKDGKTRVYYADKFLTESGTYQYRVAAAVSNAGRLTYGEYGPAISFNYTYEPEPETNYTDAFKQTGLAGYLYDPKENVFYTSDDPWQRNFGFNKLYDLASQLVWIQYDTTRFYFTYQNSDWMIQPWKGQYGAVLYGAELGVYKKYTERDADHYDCAQDADRLQMSMDFERYYFNEDGTGEWRHEFYRPYGTYWWCTGFTLGWIRFTNPLEAISANEGLTNPTYPELRANYRVTMKDYEMLEAFTQSLLDAGFTQVKYQEGVHPKNLTFSVNALDVYFPF
ncbi:MAG: DUF4474 domain-containing protein [Clostridia bacterium]|nr:DUF4474 domain-containing protein [Clostridia bacterium]MBQ4366047.1 DUF4474 domain-containing protein [Clostridia bacterium]